MPLNLLVEIQLAQIPSAASSTQLLFNTFQGNRSCPNVDSSLGKKIVLLMYQGEKKKAILNDQLGKHCVVALMSTVRGG